MKYLASAALLLLAGCISQEGGKEAFARLQAVTTADLEKKLGQVHTQRAEGRDVRWGYCKEWAASKAGDGAYAEAMSILTLCEPPLVVEQLLKRLEGMGLRALF